MRDMLKKFYRYIKKNGFGGFLLRIRIAIMTRFCSSESILWEQKQLYAYRYMRKYLYAMDSISETDTGEDKSDTIWMLWLQGIENAPDIVQKCVESVRKTCSDYNIVILNSETIFDYIELPDFILEKYRTGMITPALFSDLIRLSLLIKYGGIWVDATCFFTDKIPQYIKESPFFCFKTDMLSKPIIKGSSWFIKSKKGNPILIKTRAVLFEYLKKEKIVINYFIFHLTLALLIDKDKQSGEIWNSIPYICNMNPHVLQFHMAKKFDEQYWKYICSLSSIHKLTYKVPQKGFLDEETFLSKVILNK